MPVEWDDVARDLSSKEASFLEWNGHIAIGMQDERPDGQRQRQHVTRSRARLLASAKSGVIDRRWSFEQRIWASVAPGMNEVVNTRR